MDADPGRPRTGAEVAEALAADRGRRDELSTWARISLGLASDDIEDMLQETYIELLRYPSPIHNPNGFVFKVFQARCCRLHRYRRCRPDAAASDEELEEVGAPELPADHRLLVAEAMRRLTPRCRQLILAYYFDGKQPREIVRESGLASAKVVSAITGRCLRRLREWLLGR